MARINTVTVWTPHDIILETSKSPNFTKCLWNYYYYYYYYCNSSFFCWLFGICLHAIYFCEFFLNWELQQNPWVFLMSFFITGPFKTKLNPVPVLCWVLPRIQRHSFSWWSIADNCYKAYGLLTSWGSWRVIDSELIKLSPAAFEILPENPCCH